LEVVMIFHFQFLGIAGWEPIGAGVAGGEDPIAAALAEVRGFAGGTLPAGTYQVIEARSSETRWKTFDLGEDGQIIWEPDTCVSAEAVCASTGDEGTAPGPCPR
jgi:hypothetical protein